jgi:hypothetical protein
MILRGKQGFDGLQGDLVAKFLRQQERSVGCRSSHFLPFHWFTKDRTSECTGNTKRTLGMLESFIKQLDCEIVKVPSNGVYVLERQRTVMGSVRKQHENTLFDGIDPE